MPRLIPILIVAGLSLASAPTWAHKTPAVLGVLAADAQGPRSVRMAHGLVRAEADGSWRFFCPVRWGGPETPPMVAVGLDVWILGDAGVLWLRGDGTTLRLGGDLPVRAARATAVLGGEAFVLTTDALESRVWRLDAERATEIFRDARRFDDLEGSHGALHLARASSVGVELVALGRDGETIEDFTLANSATVATAQLTSTGDALYLVLRQAIGSTLGRIEGDRLEPLFASDTLIRGPVHANGALLVVVDGVMAKVTPSGLETVADAERYTCLDEAPSGPYACTLRYARPLDDLSGAPWFDLATIQPPRRDDLDEPTALECELEWFDFAAEAGLDPTLQAPPVPTPTPEDSSGGCTSVHAAVRASPLEETFVGLAAVVALCFLSRRKNR